MYERHPSEKLNRLFSEKPFQGAKPEEARFLFIGSDANYAHDIDSSRIFEKVYEYHTDGVAFWRRYDVHHPFLLPEYSGDGRKYHRNFSRIGFTRDDAASISFVELLHVPTVGRNKISPADLSSAHLSWLNSCILDGGSQHILISSGVARLMHQSGLFPWLPGKPVAATEALGVYWRVGSKTVFSHLHFSNYGKFETRLREEAQCIRKLRDN